MITPDSTTVSLMVSVSRGMEPAVARELASFGVTDIEERAAAVVGKGPMDAAYRACLWSRCASRVFLEIASFPAADEQELYDGVRSIDWEQHMSVDSTFAVSFTSSQSNVYHTNFGALKVKDGLVDWFRDRRGRRPSVDRIQPDIEWKVHIHNNVATLYLDFSGGPLFRRHGRTSGDVEAPLKETLGAGILVLAGYPEVLQRHGLLVDPMCGGGTLPIEAAMLAADFAPGLLRKRFGFEGWRGYELDRWRSLVKEARERDQRKRVPASAICFGFDNDPRAVRASQLSLVACGLKGWCDFQRRELSTLTAPEGEPGLVVVNPPYGQRIGDLGSLPTLYSRLGMTFKTRFPGWTVWMLTGTPELLKSVGLKKGRSLDVRNGPMDCRLVEFPILPEKEMNSADLPLPSPSLSLSPTPGVEDGRPSGSPLPGMADNQQPTTINEEPTTNNQQPLDYDRGGPKADHSAIANRLRKNLSRLRSWLKQSGVSCFRLYDADLPNYAASVDVYGDWVQVKEYERPDDVPPIQAEERLHGLVMALQDVLAISADAVFVKQRMRQRGSSQYGRLSDSQEMRVVEEGGLKFWTNPVDYLDTGLFLDHRPMRALLRKLAKGRRFLNLFCYTGAATVHAAAGGAVESVSVDLSGRYLNWLWENLVLNGLEGDQHQLVRDDVMVWLRHARQRFDLIFVDPPTFSNSKDTRDDFDVQRDHVAMLRECVRLLLPGGEIFFSNNFRRFKLDSEGLAGLQIEELSASTIPPDFARSPRIHRVWRLTR